MENHFNKHKEKLMSIDLSTLTKGQTRKLNALRNSLGNEIADDAFAKWMKTQTKKIKLRLIRF